METQGIIQTNHLTIGYGHGNKKKVIQKDLSFSLEQEKLTALLGANGAGKSTLIKTLCGFLPPLEGNILLEDKILSSYSTSILSRKIGTVLTDRNIDGGLTVYDVIGLGRYSFTGFFGTLTSDDKSIIEDAAQQVGIHHKMHTHIALLSDGERQKTMIAKAIAQQCKTIILDEPTAFLDVKSRIEITNLLRKIVKDGKTILMSTHDLELALQLSDNLWILSDKYGLEEGCTEDLILQGALNHIFEDRNIVFDSLSGTFRYNRISNQEIFIEEGNKELSYWIKNALLRNGYNCSTSKSTCHYIAKVFPITSHEIKLVLPNNKITVSSIKELIEKLLLFFPHPKQ